MKTLSVFAASVLLVFSCACSSGNPIVWKKLSSSFFTMNYPEGFGAALTDNGAYISGEFKTTLWAILGKDSKKDSVLKQIPVGIPDVNTEGVMISSIESMTVSGMKATLFNCNSWMMLVVPLNGAFISMTSVCDVEQTGQRDTARQMMQSLEILNEPMIIKWAAKPEAKKNDPKVTNNDKSVTLDQPTARNPKPVDTKGLSLDQYFINERVFFKLFKGYLIFNSSIYSVTAKGRIKPYVNPQMIFLQFMPARVGNIKDIAFTMSGGRKIAMTKIGSYEYATYDDIDINNNKSKVLICTLPDALVKITVEGELGFTGTNGEILKSIIFR